MYRYPIKKTASDNTKFKNKKINLGEAKKSNKSTRNNKKTTSSRLNSKTKTTKNSNTKKSKKIDLSTIIGVFLRIIASIAVIAGVITVVVFILVSAGDFFLPGFFKLDETKNLLLTTNESAEKQGMYFIHLSPDSQMISVVNIDPELPVSVLGGYGTYPIRSLSPLLTLDNKDKQSILATYNFALGEVIDEVYFVNDLPDLMQKKNLEKTLRDLTLKHWQQYHKWPDLLTNAYFFVKDQIASNFYSENVTVDNMEIFHQKLYAKNNITDCSVVVINGTSQNGLAAKVAGVLEKSGFLVTRLASETHENENTVIYYDEEVPACLELVKRAAKVFPQEPQLVNDKEMLKNYRVSSAILIGNDLQD